jgi:YVTN family beta-propeller protein
MLRESDLGSRSRRSPGGRCYSLAMAARALAVAMVLAGLLGAQTRYTISTIAGALGSSDGVPAIDATLNRVSSIVPGSSGNLFLADEGTNLILEITANGVMSTYAGGGPTDGPNNASGVPALEASIFSPRHLTRDEEGNLYFAEPSTIRRISTKGIVDTIAGSGQLLFPNSPVPQNVPATSAALAGSGPIFPEASGGFLFEEGSNVLFGNPRIRHVSSDGILTTLVDKVDDPMEISTFEPSGDLLITNYELNQISRVAMNGKTTLIAGTAEGGSSGDNGPAIDAGFSGITALAESENKNIYVAQQGYFRIREISNGIVRTIAGTGTEETGPAENVPATSVAIGNPQSLGIASDGTVYFSEFFGAGQRVRRITPSGILSTVAGGQGVGVTRPSRSVGMSLLGGVAVDGTGNVYVADVLANCLRKVSPDGLMTTVAGNGFFGSTILPAVGTSVPAETAISLLNVVMDPHGNPIIFTNNAVFRLNSNETVTTIGTVDYLKAPAGESIARGAVDRSDHLYLATNAGAQRLNSDGSVTALTHGQAVDLAFDNSGNAYVAGLYEIMKVLPSGKVQRFAGTGVSGMGHENGPAMSTQFQSIAGIAVDSHNNVYVSDGFKIRVIDTAGVISTIAALGPGTVDGGTALASPFLSPQALTVDSQGNVYFCNSSTVRRLTPAHKTVDAEIGPLNPTSTQGLANTAVGTISAVLNDAQTEIILTVTHDVQNATAISIRRGTPASPGGIVYTFAHTFSPAVAVWAINASDLAAFLAGDLFVEVDGSLPGNEIAGQLVPAPRLWITGNTTNTVSSVDSVTMATIDLAPAGKDPFGVGFNSDGSHLYVTAYLSNELNVFDPATLTPVATIATPRAPILTTPLPDRSGLLVTDDLGSQLSVINFASNSVTSTVPVGANPIGVAVSADGKRAYTADQGTASLSIVDLSTQTATMSVPLGGTPWGVALSPDGSRIYVTLQTPNVAVVDTGSTKVLASIPLGNEPYPRGIVLNSKGSVAYVAGSYTNRVFVLDLTTNTLAGTIAVSSPQGMALSADGSKLYAASLYSPVLTVIDTRSNKVIDTVGIVDAANWIALR